MSRPWLNDLGFSGLPFTYDNKRAHNNSSVRIRHYHAMADNIWHEVSPS
jgi:hypothetical protein